jgi:heme exporter protein A
VGTGAFLAVTGANGSGKSSLLRVLAGLLRPEGGGFTVAGRQGDEPIAHYLGHADALKPTLTLRETLRFWAALYGGRGDLADAAGQVGLGHALALPVGVLSAGQRRRAGLARLLIAPRPLWLLDEPASALDRHGEAMLACLLEQHRAAGGIIVAAIHGDFPVTPDAVLNLGGTS